MLRTNQNEITYSLKMQLKNSSVNNVISEILQVIILKMKSCKTYF